MSAKSARSMGASALFVLVAYATCITDVMLAQKVVSVILNGMIVAGITGIVGVLA